MIAAAVVTIGLVALAVIGTRKVQQTAINAKPKESISIAVLPLENVGSVDGKDFADGMTEEITNRLASLHGLRVIGPQSAKAYAGTNKTPQQIADELQVQYLLTGTLRWDKSSEGRDLVRVSPSLVKTSDGTQVWAEAYQTVLAGMFDVESKVANQVANVLNLSLLTPEKDAITTRPTRSPEAYTKYLRGKRQVEAHADASAVTDGAALLEQATNEDPKFLLAWAWLSIANTESFFYAGDKSGERLSAAESALKKAQAFEQSHPDVHLARGVLLYHGRNDLMGARKAFQEVLKSRPSDVKAVLFTAAIDRQLGNWDESVRGFQNAIVLEPRNAATIFDLAETLAYLKRYSEAESSIDRAMTLAPNDPRGPLLKAKIAIAARGNVPEAIEHLRNARDRVKPPSALSTLVETMWWPAIEDPDLRRFLIADGRYPDVGAADFYANKLNVFYYVGDSTRARAYADSAVRALEDTISSARDRVRSYERLAVVHATRGRRAEALRAIAKADELGAVVPDVFADAERANLRVRIFTLLTDAGAALDAMEKRLNVPGGLSVTEVRRDPIYSRFVSNPRYRRLAGL